MLRAGLRRVSRKRIRPTALRASSGGRGASEASDDSGASGGEPESPPGPRPPVKRLLVGLGNPGPKYERTRHNVGFMALRHFMERRAPELLARPARLGDPGAEMPEHMTVPCFDEDKKLQALVARAEFTFQAAPGDKPVPGPPATGDDLVDMTSERRKARTLGDGVPFPVVACTALLPQSFMNRSGTSVRKALDSGRYRLKRNPMALNRGDELLVVYDDVSIPFGTLSLKPKGGAGSHNGLGDILRKAGTERFARLKVGIGSASARTPDDVGALDRYVLGRFLPHEQDKLPLLCDFISEVLRVYLHRGLASAAVVANTFDVDAYAHQVAGAKQGGNNGKQ